MFFAASHYTLHGRVPLPPKNVMLGLETEWASVLIKFYIVQPFLESGWYTGDEIKVVISWHIDIDFPNDWNGFLKFNVTMPNCSKKYDFTFFKIKLNDLNYKKHETGTFEKLCTASFQTLCVEEDNCQNLFPVD